MLGPERLCLPHKFLFGLLQLGNLLLLCLFEIFGC